MSTIVLRSVKNAPLTNAEVDANFTNLNTDKTELGGTYSAGTANGVLFLSSSKVLTTGSALTFDGTNLGVGTSSPTAKIHAFRSSGSSDGGATNSMLFLESGGSNANLIKFNGVAATEIAFGRATGSDSFYWGAIAGPTEWMRLTSTGLGIGTSSPTAKLSTSVASGSTASMSMRNATSGLTYSWYASDSGQNGFNGLGLWDGTDFRLAVNSAGNVGIGTSSPGAKLDVNSTGAGVQTVLNLRNDADTLGVVGTAIHLGYASPAANYGTRIVNYGNPAAGFAGDLVFERGNGTGYSESMRLDSSGNLGLGVTPSAWGSVFKSFDISQAAISGTGGGALVESGNAYFNGTSWLYKVTGTATRVELNAGASGAAWYTAPSGTAGDAISFTQAMTLDASGNLALGTSSPVSIASYNIFTTNGTAGSAVYLQQGAATKGRLITTANELTVDTTTTIPLVFGTNNTERARIDTDGNFLIGTTTQEGRLTVNCPSANQNGANIVCSNTSGPNYVLNLQSNASVANTTNLIRGYSNTSTGVFFVAGNGDVTNTNNSYGAISDAKLKENVVEATPKLDKLNQVRIVNFNMIGEEQKQLGVIAQELEQVFPGMVDESPDRDQEGNDLGTTTKSVKYSVFVPMLIKALQEATTEINSLKARLDAANL